MPENRKPGAPARAGGPSKSPNSKPAGRPGSPGSLGGSPGEWPGQPGTQPGDEWGGDNPGNVHAAGVDDHVFFHRDGAGPHAGRVVAHGVHGCQVEDDAGARHKVRWGRVLGLKKKAARAAKVVDRGVGGAILEHEDGRRVFVAGELPLPDEQVRFSSVAQLEAGASAPKPRRVSDLEEFARAGSQDLAKSDHPCEGPALCRVCADRVAAADPSADLAKAVAAGVDSLAALAARMRRGRPRSVGVGRLPILFYPAD